MIEESRLNAEENGILDRYDAMRLARPDSEVQWLSKLSDDEGNTFCIATIKRDAHRLKVPVWEADHAKFGTVYFLVIPGKALPARGDLSAYTNDVEDLTVELERYEQSLGNTG